MTMTDSRTATTLSASDYNSTVREVPASLFNFPNHNINAICITMRSLQSNRKCLDNNMSCSVFKRLVHGIFIVLELRSLHTQSEILVLNFRTLKNKYDLTLCQSRLHTASETFISHKKIWIRFDFLRFRIRSKHFDRKG